MFPVPMSHLGRATPEELALVNATLNLAQAPFVVLGLGLETAANHDISRIRASVAVTSDIEWPLGEDGPILTVKSLGPRRPHRGEIGLEFAYCVPRTCQCDEKTGLWSLVDGDRQWVLKRFGLSGFYIGVNGGDVPGLAIGDVEGRVLYDADCNISGWRIDKLILAGPPWLEGRDEAARANGLLNARE